MLCYRCGSHVPDGSETCGACGQKFASGNLRQATGTFSRKKMAANKLDGAPFAAGDVLADRYVIKHGIGSGPLGFVFKAQDKEIDVDVALKVISPRLLQTQDERKGFAKEVRLARKLSHNNIVRVYEEGEDKDHPFYTMQYLDGLTLRRIIDLRREKNQNFALKELEPIFTQIAAGLESAHKVGVHGDLKPENIIVLPDLLKLTDFGISLGIPRQPFVAAQKARNNGHRYLSPEYVGQQEVDRRADVYAMGVILGEMVAGIFPDGQNTAELRSKNPELPPETEGLFRRATNENPLMRHASAGEFFNELADILAKADRLKPPPPPRRAPPPPPAQKPPPPVPSDAEIHADGTVAPARKSERQPPPEIAAREEKQQRRRDPSGKPPPPVPDVELDEGGAGRWPVDRNEKRNGRVPDNVPSGEPTAIIRTDPGPKTQDLPTAAPLKRPRRRGPGKLVALALVGVGAGAAAGYLYLAVLRKPAPVEPVKPPEVAVTNPDKPVVKPSTDLDLAATDPVVTPPEKIDPKNDKKPADDTIEVKVDPKNDKAPDKPDKKPDPKVAKNEKVEKAEKQPDKSADPVKDDEEKKRRDALDKAFGSKTEDKKDEKKDDTKVAAFDPGTGAAAGKLHCPAGMKLVGAGKFRMGSAKDDQMRGFDEVALADVEVKPYCIDVYEYPNKAGVNPVTGVNFSAAESMCKAKGKRLCQEDEWEKACKGPGNARFPYGNSFDAEACNTQDAEGEERVVVTNGSFAKCRSAYGVFDMSGNVAEWTASKYTEEAADRAIKGGSATRPDYESRCAARKNGPPGTKKPEIGFRCCADAN